ncbi:hypothetical protein ACIGO8_33415 [Streptomyces sp. NPDC053493]|uniref:hypothetical protein n=1 Tax=Streptomyces sp. NPDC053493 TaxID=3365705 RepID=UPI0037D7E151
MPISRELATESHDGSFSPTAAERYKAGYEARPGVSDVQVVPVDTLLARPRRRSA